MKNCIVIVILVCLFGCGEGDPDPVDNTVHLAGFLATPSGAAVASYWKDGTYTGLMNESIYSQVNSLYVDGSSVLVGGWKWIDEPHSHSAVIWQDGAETVIAGGTASMTLVASRNGNLFGVWHDGTSRWVYSKNGIIHPLRDTALNYGPTGLALLGDDMYISGSTEYHDWTDPDARTYQYAQCWKNGQVIFTETDLSGALCIFLHGNDIYMAGYVENAAAATNNACYWKNGERFDLPGIHAMASSMFVTDDHVYVSGMVDQQAVYWKDGVATSLTTSGTFSMANSIFVQGEDVHVGGFEHGYPAYWKNDVKQTIANQDRRGQIKFVVVGKSPN